MDPIGRAQELARLKSFWAGAERDGAALLITGEPGIGKTALLDAAADLASMSGAQVVRAGGVQFEAGVSFAGLHQVLHPLLAGLDELDPTQATALNTALGVGGGRRPDQLMVCASALMLLRQSAMHAPMLVIVDDVPWLDRPSAIVLGFIARRLAGSRVGLLAAARPGEASFFDPSTLPNLTLGPLDDDAAEELLTTHYPALAAPVRRRLLAEAAGNPLALLELPAALTVAQQGGKLPSVLPLGQRLQRLFADRIQDLPQRTKRVLLLAALDSSCDLMLLEAAARATKPPAGIDDLSPAERIHLVHVDDRSGRVSFRHPLTRAAVVELSTSEERRAAHRSLAGQLVGRAGEEDRRAWHLAEATLGVDEGVAALLEEVAYRTISRGDGVGAVAALTRAAELSPPGAARGRRFAEAAYTGADVNGRLDDAAQLLADAHDADPQLQDSLQAAVTAAFVLVNGDGDIDTVHRLLVGAIENSGTVSEIALEHALSVLSLVCFFGGRAELWRPFYTVVERLEPNVPRSLQLVRETLADPARSTVAARAALDVAVADLAGEADPLVVIQVGYAAGTIDRLAPARSAFLRVAEIGRDSGAAGLVIQAQVLLSMDSYWSGRWDDAVERADEVVELCELHGFPLFAISARHVQAAVAASRGDDAALTEALRALTSWGKPRGAGLAAQMEAHARSVEALGRSDYETAFRWSTSISPAGVLASHAQFALWVLMDLVESAVHTGRDADATAHLEAVRRAGIQDLSPRLTLLTRAASAMAADDEHAAPLFEQALATTDADQWPFYLARVELAFGERLRRLRRRNAARGHLELALDTFGRLGAAPWIARASSELRATGNPPASRQRTAASPAPQTAPDLTPQERSIAELAAAGLTNKQIGDRLYLSHRTISGHLHRVFPKLGITSRAALRDALEDSRHDTDLDTRHEKDPAANTASHPNPL